MVFLATDLPPHYAPNTPRDDIQTGESRLKKKKKCKVNKAMALFAEVASPEMESVPTVQIGYVGKQKGALTLYLKRIGRV